MTLPDGTPAGVTDMTPRRARMLGPIQVVRRHSKATGSARAVLGVIATYADADTLLARPGRATLERDSGKSRSTVRRAIRELEELGELATVIPGHGDTASTYRITLDATPPASSPPVDNPGDTRPFPNGRRVHSEPGEGSPRPRGRVHSEPLSCLTGIDRGEGQVSDRCAAHATVENPPPCRRCKERREAAEAAAVEARKLEAADRRAADREKARLEVEAAAAVAAPPPPDYLEARRRRGR